MKKSIFVLATIVALFCSTSLFAANAQKKADQATDQWRYDVEDVGMTGKQGTVMFKIWSYSKKENIAISQADKNAVHAVLFKGVGTARPMVDPAAAEKYADFFDEFFQEGGGYHRYVQLSNNGAVKPADNIKLKKEYKIGIVVSVKKDELRKFMESKGIVAKLGGMF